MSSLITRKTLEVDRMMMVEASGSTFVLCLSKSAVEEVAMTLIDILPKSKEGSSGLAVHFDDKVGEIFKLSDRLKEKGRHWIAFACNYGQMPVAGFLVRSGHAANGGEGLPNERM